MESHHPAELEVVKRVRMEGVRVTFFHLTAAIKAINTMEILVSKIVMGTMMVTIGGNTVTALTSVYVITPPGIFMVLMASMVAVKRKNVTLTPFILTLFTTTSSSGWRLSILHPPCCSAAHVTCNSHWDND